MTRLQRIKNLIIATLMMFCAVILLLDPEDGYNIVLIIFEISLLMTSIRGLVYYFTMARHMVDGRVVLYKNLLLLDLALFVGAIMDIPAGVMVIYLSLLIGFAAVIDIMYGIQAKKVKSRIWLGKLIYGLVELAICVVSLCLIKKPWILPYVYALVLIYHAVIKAVEAFKKTAIVYVQ